MSLKFAFDLDRIKIISDIAAVWFGLVGAFLAGIFAIHQYLDKERSDRVHETLEVLNRFNRAPYLDARLRLDTKWLNRQPALLDLVEKNPEAFGNYVRQFIKEESLAPDVFTMIEFYDMLAACVSTKLCDTDASAALFAVDAGIFFRNHYPFIKSERAVRGGSDRLAFGLEQFVEQAHALNN